MAVLVLDRKKRPLMPCAPKRARKLLACGRARVHRLFPFCIRLIDRCIEQSALQPLRLSLDPGSKTTGLAILRMSEATDTDGVIEPVMHIVFLMELAHRDHILAKARGGSDRVSNLTLACASCNSRKAAQDIRDFLAQDPARLARILKQAKAPLRDAAAVNATRWALLGTLKQTGLPVETGTGGQTKWNRSRFGITKTHALDAACVGVMRDVVATTMPTLRVKCTGRGSRCKTRLDRYGFPRAYLTRRKTAFGFRTGDMVTATVPAGKNKGAHKGRVAVRMTGNFNIQSGIPGVPTVQGISHKHCHVVQRADGYGYVWQATPIGQPQARAATASRSAPFLTALKDGVSRSKIG